jgi:hypothetical protein
MASRRVCGESDALATLAARRTSTDRVMGWAIDSRLTCGTLRELTPLSARRSGRNDCGATLTDRSTPETELPRKDSLLPTDGVLILPELTDDMLLDRPLLKLSDREKPDDPRGWLIDGADRGAENELLEKLLLPRLPPLKLLGLLTLPPPPERPPPLPE